MLRAGYHISRPAAEIVMSVGKERLHHRMIEGKHKIELVPVSNSHNRESEETVNLSYDEGRCGGLKMVAYCEKIGVLQIV